MNISNYDFSSVPVSANLSAKSFDFAAAVLASYRLLNARREARCREQLNWICQQISQDLIERRGGQQQRIMAKLDGVKPYDIATLRAASVRPSQNLGMGWWEYYTGESPFVEAMRQSYVALNLRRFAAYEAALVRFCEDLGVPRPVSPSNYHEND